VYISVVLVHNSLCAFKSACKQPCSVSDREPSGHGKRGELCLLARLQSLWGLIFFIMVAAMGPEFKEQVCDEARQQGRESPFCSQ